MGGFVCIFQQSKLSPDPVWFKSLVLYDQEILYSEYSEVEAPSPKTFNVQHHDIAFPCFKFNFWVKYGAKISYEIEPTGWGRVSLQSRDPKNEIHCTHARINWDLNNAFPWSVRNALLGSHFVRPGAATRFWNVGDLDCLLRYPNVWAGIRLECRISLISDIISNTAGRKSSSQDEVQEQVTEVALLLFETCVIMLYLFYTYGKQDHAAISKESALKLALG